MLERHYLIVREMTNGKTWTSAVVVLMKNRMSAVGVGTLVTRTTNAACGVYNTCAAVGAVLAETAVGLPLLERPRLGYVSL